MVTASIDCHQTCRGLCKALESAAANGQKSLVLYEQLRDQCTYPDVHIMLAELIVKQKEILSIIETAQRHVREKFDVLDQVRESFEKV